MGIETMPVEETDDVLTKMDKATSVAIGCINDGQKFVQMKMMEVARLGEVAAEAVRVDLEKVQKQLEETLEKAKKFQAETAKRRRDNFIESIKFKVDEAEKAIATLKKSGAELSEADP